MSGLVGGLQNHIGWFDSNIALPFDRSSHKSLECFFYEE